MEQIMAQFDQFLRNVEQSNIQQLNLLQRWDPVRGVFAHCWESNLSILIAVPIGGRRSLMQHWRGLSSRTEICLGANPICKDIRGLCEPRSSFRIFCGDVESWRTGPLITKADGMVLNKRQVQLTFSPYDRHDIVSCPGHKYAISFRNLWTSKFKWSRESPAWSQITDGAR